MEVRRGRPSEPKPAYKPIFDPKEIREQYSRALDKRLKYEFGDTKAEVEKSIERNVKEIVENGIAAIIHEYGLDYGFGEWRIKHHSSLYGEVVGRARSAASRAWDKVFRRIESDGIDISDAQYKAIHKAYADAFVEGLVEQAIVQAQQDARNFQGFEEED